MIENPHLQSLAKKTLESIVKSDEVLDTALEAYIDKHPELAEATGQGEYTSDYHDLFDAAVETVVSTMFELCHLAPEAAVQEPSPNDSTQGVCNPLISDDETFALAVSIGRARGDEGFSIEEVLKIVRWAEDIRLHGTILEAVLAGNVLVNIRKDGELVFTAGDEPDGL